MRPLVHVENLRFQDGRALAVDKEAGELPDIEGQIIHYEGSDNVGNKS